MSPERQNKRLLITIGVVVLLYGVGILGLSIPEYRPLFQSLIPAHLLISLVLVLGFHTGWNDAFTVFGTLAFWIGIGAEVIGIHTGYMFGDYVYGLTLGPMLWEVPIVIGVYWFMLVYLSGTIFHKATDNDYYAAFLGATAMTAFDYIVEPVAGALDMWHWKFDLIPASNYLTWWGVAFVIHLIYRKANFQKDNPLAVYLFLAMIFFFAILNFTLDL